MKKILHKVFIATIFISLSASLRAQTVYWREGFEGGTISTTNPTTAGAPNDYYADGVSSTSWFLHNTYRTTGTPCGGVYGTNHLRILNITNATPADTSYVVLPPVGANGISEIHFSRCEATAAGPTNRMTFWVRPDTVGNINPITSGVGWTRIAIVQPFSNANVDTFVTVPSPLNLSTRRVAISLSQASNADVDSIFLVSATPVLPITFTNVKIYQKLTGVQIDWSNATEANMERYAIERSSDGRIFTEIASVVATGNRNSLTNYSWYDASPLHGNNFYRIKGVERDGNSKYTGILKFAVGKGQSDLIIAPNPVKGNQLNLQLNNLVNGVYTLNLYNAVGQQAYSKTINHDGGSSTLQLNLSSSIKAGVYNLQLKDENTVINRKVIIQ